MEEANSSTTKHNGTNGLSGKTHSQWEEITIDVPWGVIQGKWWGCRNKQPILALHGWQDNCGTFDRLCPLLPADTSILCIDFPGHGHSSPYPTGMQYYLFWDGIMLIRRIVRKFNWRNITLLGHSMGGALSFMYAASFPEEVDKLIMIDIAGPAVRDHAAKTGWAVDKFLDYETIEESKLPCYNFEEMEEIVLKAYEGSVDRQSVRVLMKRGTEAAPKHLHRNGYHFKRDLRLKVSMLGMFTEEQVYTYAKQLRCKVLNIRGSPGMKFDKPHIYTNIIDILKANCKQVIYKEVPGTHHLHLNTPERVAPLVKSFLADDA